MKLTPELKKYLGKQCYYYSSKLKIKTPLLIYDDSELKEIGVTDKQLIQIKVKELGRSWKEDNKVWLNVDNTDFTWQILDTLVHELLHLYDQKLRHGSKFQSLVNRIIIGDYP